MNTETLQNTPSRSRRYRVIFLTIITFGLISLLVALGTVKPLIPVPETSSDTLILYALSSINFIASLVLLTILTRNLLKLRRERSENRLGSKFKTKMVVFSIGISLLPGILQFFFAYGLLNTSLDIWFGSPTSKFYDSASNMQQLFLQRELEDMIKISRTLLRLTNLRGPQQNLSLDEDEKRLLQREYNNQQLRFLSVNVSDNTLFSQGEEISQLNELLKAQEQVKLGSAYSQWIKGDDLRIIYLIVGQPITQSTKPIGGIFLVKQLPQNLADSFVAVMKRSQDRDRLSQNAKQFKITNLYLLGAMTLLIIFAATWIALYVASGITVPIQSLAEATQALGRGNYDIRVLCPAEDELATLVQSFNQMAAQLSENRHNLEIAAKEQRETNSALEERRRYIETILQSLSTGIISLDSEHLMITINQAALNILQCEKVAAKTPVANLFNLKNQEEILRLVRRAKRVGQVTREVEIQSQDLLLHTSVTVTPLRDKKGIFQGSVLMIEDISGLIAAQRSAVWSEVARRMAHEIKNPLTPIQLCAERIAKNSQKISGKLEEKYTQIVEECTTTIKQEVGTLQRMVDEFSRFARLPEAKLELGSLNEVVQESLKLYEDRLDDIKLDTAFDEDLLPINLDKEQIKRTMVNLIDNAAEAMINAEDKVLSISTEYLNQQDLIRLTISDTGHGIKPEDKEKLFLPYFSTRKRGTGLGLAIVSHIITDHLGKIWVEDNKPYGTKFIIELPVAGSRVE
ncbi:MAG: HAMP domain-containing protein [Acidobacteria bacterium]|nr:HAMP domain-containing protein [Acidobacteriota bacterium]